MSRNQKVSTKALLLGGALAGALFTTAWIIGGILSTHYDPLRHLISTLVLGEFGWLQVMSFFASGLLVIGFGVALRRKIGSLSKWGPWLVGLAGVGLIGAGIFATDPSNGFPLGTPLVPSELTMNGNLHNLFASLFLFGLPIAAFVFARFFRKQSERTWAIYSTLSGLAFFAVFFLQKFDVDAAARFGLYQRIGITANLMWLTLLAVYMLRNRKQH